MIETIESRQTLDALQERHRVLPNEVMQAARRGDVDGWLRLRMELDALPLEIEATRRALADAEANEAARHEADEIAAAEQRCGHAEAQVESCRIEADSFRRGMARDHDGRTSERDKTELAQLQREYRKAVEDLRAARILLDRVRGVKSGPPSAA